MHITIALERYLRHHRASNSSPKTLTWHRDCVGKFAIFLDDSDIADLRADDLRRWIESLQGQALSAATVANRVRSVKAFGRWLVEEEYLVKDPFLKVKQFPVPDTAKDILTPTEIEKLLAACNKRTQAGMRDRALILLLYSTGLRASEALDLTTADINNDQGVIKIAQGKGGKFRIVPLSPTVERALDRYLDHKNRKPKGTDRVFLTDGGEPMRVNTLQLALQRHGRSVGLHANPHMLRHSCAVQYLRNGGRLERLQKLLGHSTIDMTLHYARLAGVDVAEDHAIADPIKALRKRI